MYRIYIDPGHGGQQPGAVSADRTLLEKDVTLQWAFLVQRYSETARVTEAGELVLPQPDICCANIVPQTLYTVRLGRTTDVAQSLLARAAAANRWAATAFISLHCNAHSSAAASGYEVWQRTGVRHTLAQHVYRASLASVQAALLARGETAGACRGVRHTKRYTVLNRTKMPAIVVEAAFLSNPAESQLLRQEWYLAAHAWGVVQGCWTWCLSLGDSGAA